MTDQEIQAAVVDCYGRVAATPGAAFSFLGELVADSVPAEPAPDLTERLRGRLAECVEQDESGTQRLTVTLPDSGALDRLAARGLVRAEPDGRWALTEAGVAAGRELVDGEAGP